MGYTIEVVDGACGGSNLCPTVLKRLATINHHGSGLSLILTPSFPSGLHPHEAQIFPKVDGSRAGSGRRQLHQKTSFSNHHIHQVRGKTRGRGENLQGQRTDQGRRDKKYWATRSFVQSFALTAHSYGYSALLASLAVLNHFAYDLTFMRAGGRHRV